MLIPSPVSRFRPLFKVSSRNNLLFIGLLRLRPKHWILWLQPNQLLELEWTLGWCWKVSRFLLFSERKLAAWLWFRPDVGVRFCLGNFVVGCKGVEVWIGGCRFVSFFERGLSYVKSACVWLNELFESL